MSRTNTSHAFSFIFSHIFVYGSCVYIQTVFLMFAASGYIFLKNVVLKVSYNTETCGTIIKSRTAFMLNNKHASVVMHRSQSDWKQTGLLCGGTIT